MPTVASACCISPCSALPGTARTTRSVRGVASPVNWMEYSSSTGLFLLLRKVKVPEADFDLPVKVPVAVMAGTSTTWSPSCTENLALGSTSVNCPSTRFSAAS